jgi:prepilin-type N-terminal cleavage/methylation domain-containing protein/prepilin-type processing-associated H-X9-DG protein
VKTARHDGRKAADSHRHALTLVELLVVIAIIALLAAMLLPVLSSAKANTKQVACAGNLRQLEIAFQSYASDNGGYLTQNVPMAEELVPAPPGTNGWVYGNMKEAEEATNALLIKIGELYPYIPQAGSYHCPADAIVAGGLPRVRSYSMNSWIGSTGMEAGQEPNPFRIFLKDSDLAAGMPSSIWVDIDEHVASLNDGWFEVTMDDSAPFIKLPATRHQNAYNLNFADGHVEVYHLRTLATQNPEMQAAAFTPFEPLDIPASNTDWIKLKQVTTSP